MKNELHFEHGDLTGEISIHLKEGVTLNELFAGYIHDFNADRLQPYAFRLSAGKEPVLTLYAADNYRQENSSADTGKIPVKKYKIPGVNLKDFFDHFGEINITVTTKEFPIEEMIVINK